MIGKKEQQLEEEKEEKERKEAEEERLRKEKEEKDTRKEEVTEDTSARMYVPTEEKETHWENLTMLNSNMPRHNMK